MVTAISEKLCFELATESLWVEYPAPWGESSNDVPLLAAAYFTLHRELELHDEDEFVVVRVSHD